MGTPVNNLRPRVVRGPWGAPNSGKEDGVPRVLSDVRPASAWGWFLHFNRVHTGDDLHKARDTLVLTAHLPGQAQVTCTRTGIGQMQSCSRGRENKKGNGNLLPFFVQTLPPLK